MNPQSELTRLMCKVTLWKILMLAPKEAYVWGRQVVDGCFELVKVWVFCMFSKGGNGVGYFGSHKNLLSVFPMDLLVESDSSNVIS